MPSPVESRRSESSPSPHVSSPSPDVKDPSPSPARSGLESDSSSSPRTRVPISGHRGRLSRPFHAIKLFCRNEAMWNMHEREESIVSALVEIRGDIVQANDIYGGRDLI